MLDAFHLKFVAWTNVLLFYSILFYLYYIYFKSILVPQLVVPDLGFLADSVLQVFHLKHHVLNTNVQKLIIPAV
jgi:hypothetical protein